MKRSSHPLLAACLALAFAACNDGSERPTDPGPASGTQVLTGTLRLPDGKPAAGAVVRLYPVDFVPGPAAKTGVTVTTAAAAASGGDAVYVTRTAADGSFAVDSLEQGEYNILGELDGLVAYQDSVFLRPGSAAQTTAKLQPAGSVTARVQLQPHHDARSATVHVLGTRAFSNVDRNGRFTLQGLAEGTYALRINPGTDGYTILYTSLTVRSGERDSLTAALRPDFTGIPVVTGIRAQLDTLAGTVRVSWDPVDYPRFKSYVILRQRSDDPLPSAEVIGAATDTVFTDQLYPGTGSDFGLGSDYGLASGNFPAPIPWEYQVRVRSQSEQLGEVFGGATLDAVSPSYVRTHVEFRTLGTLDGLASRNDTVKVVALFRNKTRKLTEVWWKDSGTEVVREKELGEGVASGSDTLTLVGDRLGERTVECQVADESREAPAHRFQMAFVAMPPTADAGKDTILGSGKVHVLKGRATTRIGKVVKYEWDVGATGNFVEAPEGELTITTPDTHGNLPCILRVTNEDGETDEDRVEYVLRDIWKEIGTTPFYGNDCRIVGYQGRFWQIGGYKMAGGFAALYSSEDGVAWREETPNIAEATMRINYAAFVLRDTLWVAGGHRQGNSFSIIDDIFASADGTNWTRMGDSPVRECGSAKAVVLRDTVYLIGTYVSNFAYSADARNWTQVQPPAGENIGGREVNMLATVGGKILISLKANEFSWVEYWTYSQGGGWERYGSLERVVDIQNPGWISQGSALSLFGGRRRGTSTNEKELYSTENGVSWIATGGFPRALGNAPTAFIHDGKIRIIDAGVVFGRD